MNSPEEEVTMPSRTRREITDEEFSQIRKSLQGLQFGAVQITVQDGVVVQIDRTEKRRLRRPNEKSAS